MRPAPVEAASLPVPAISSGPVDLLALWMDGKSPNTVRTYRAALAAFAAFMDVADAGVAVRTFLAAGHAGANATALAWRNRMVEAVRDGELRPKTLNLRLAALRSVVKLARLAGLVTWTVDVSGVKATTYRDTAGPGLDRVRAMLEIAASNADETKAARDQALVRVLWETGLRRAEVVALDVADVDLAAGVASVTGKGRLERERKPLAPQACAAIRAYLELAGHTEGALFRNRRGRRDGERMTGAGLYHVVRDLAKKAGVGHVRPHGFRHSGATALLDACNGDRRRTQAWGRWRDGRTVDLYDDARTDTVRESTNMLADMLA